MAVLGALKQVVSPCAARGCQLSAPDKPWLRPQTDTGAIVGHSQQTA